MSLEQKLRNRAIAVQRLPSEEVMQRVQQGRKFIVVEDGFGGGNVPEGYTLVDTKYKGESFKALVPQSLLFFMANPGEGNTDEALEQLADFYGDAEEFEEEQIGEGKTSVQEMNWATLARGNYETYLFNKLVRHKNGGLTRGEDGEPVAEFNPDTIRELKLDDPYIQQRVKAIAAVALGKTAEQVKEYGVGDILKHVTIRKSETRALTKEEFKHITCWAGSHYEIKEEYAKDNDGVKYDIARRHDRDYMVGTVTTTEKNVPVFDAKIHQLESEIAEYRAQNKQSTGRHDEALTRAYINLAFIAKEQKNAQLDIKPPVERQEVKNDSK